LTQVLSFIALLPELIKLAKSARETFGDNADKFLRDLALATNLELKAKEEGVTLEKKRELRREALRLGIGMFGRID